MIDLCFTNDWELYGDGSGDYYEVQHNPTLELLKYLEKNNAGMTFFAEIGQQITFKNSGLEKYQKIASDGEILLNSALDNPLNDVQLHIHPQWFFPEFDVFVGASGQERAEAACPRIAYPGAVAKHRILSR